MAFGKGRGRPKPRFPENIINPVELEASEKVARIVEDRVCWRKLVKGATADRTQQEVQGSGFAFRHSLRAKQRHVEIHLRLLAVRDGRCLQKRTRGGRCLRNSLICSHAVK